MRGYGCLISCLFQGIGNLDGTGKGSWVSNSLRPLPTGGPVNWRNWLEIWMEKMLHVEFPSLSKGGLGLNNKVPCLIPSSARSSKLPCLFPFIAKHAPSTNPKCQNTYAQGTTHASIQYPTPRGDNPPLGPSLPLSPPPQLDRPPPLTLSRTHAGLRDRAAAHPRPLAPVPLLRLRSPPHHLARPPLMHARRSVQLRRRSTSSPRPSSSLAPPLASIEVCTVTRPSPIPSYAAAGRGRGTRGGEWFRQLLARGVLPSAPDRPHFMGTRRVPRTRPGGGSGGNLYPSSGTGPGRGGGEEGRVQVWGA